MNRDQVIIVVQARMGSARLPGKVLKEISGKPLLQHLIERLKLVKQARSVIVATSNRQEDDALEKLCKDLKIPCYRGSENDVLDRYASVIKQDQKAKAIVRITADCPLIDPKLIDRAIEASFKEEFDWVGISADKGFPRGFDTEVIKTKTLLKEHLENLSPEAREHVTIGIYTHPEKYSLCYLEPTDEYKMPLWRLCVDEESDFILVQLIYQKLYTNQAIPSEALLQFLKENPYLSQMNTHVKQKAPIRKKDK